MSSRRPPRLSEILLSLVPPSTLRSEGVLGDLEEEFQELSEARGARYARRWYRRQALRMAGLYVLPWRRPPDPRAALRPADLARSASRLEGLGQDLRHALRLLRLRPGFTLLAVAALALGIGATTTMFSAMDAVVLRVFQLPEPERVVQIWDQFPSTEPGREVQVSVPNFEDYRARQDAFERIAAFQPGVAYLASGDRWEPLTALTASADLLPILGVEPALGRGFQRRDDETGTPLRVLLSDGFWRTRLGADPDVVGSTIRLRVSDYNERGFVERPYEVVGVLPRDFHMPPMKIRVGFSAFATPDVVLPLGTWTWGVGNRGMWAFRVLARLSPGVSVQEARDEMGAIAAGIAETNPETNGGYANAVTPLPQLVREANGRRMTVFLLAAGLVLLIACANVAALLLGGGLARERELTLRAALGAGRGRLARQLLTECVLLALMGGAAGVAVAWALSRLVLALAPAGFYNLDQANIDLRVLGFTLALSAATVLGFGLLPALRGSRADPNATLRPLVHGRRGAGAHGLWGIVVAQVATAFMLLAGTGLLAATLANLLRSDPGFRAESVAIFSLRTLPPGLSRFDGQETQAALYESIAERLKARPEVLGVTAGSDAPLPGRDVGAADFTPGDRPPLSPTERELADWIMVAPDYFETYGIPILEGRGLTAADAARERSARTYAPENAARGEPLPELPVVVNEHLARRYWPDQSALGKVMYWGVQDPTKAAATATRGEGTWDQRYPPPFPLRIVGVARSVNLVGLGEEPRLQYYTLGVRADGRWLGVRVRGDAAAAIPGLRAAILDVDPEISIGQAIPLEERVDRAAASARFQLSLVGAFSGLATVLAAIGIFGVVAFTMHRRTHEIGVRLALGARHRDIVRGALARTGTMIAFGLALGAAAFLAAGRLLGSLLYGVAPADPRLLLAAVTVLAALAPCVGPVARPPARTRWRRWDTSERGSGGFAPQLPPPSSDTGRGPASSSPSVWPLRTAGTPSSIHTGAGASFR